MGSISIGLSMDQVGGGRSSNLIVFSDIAPGMALPVPAGTGSRHIRITSLDIYKGNYRVETDTLSSGPVAVKAPQIAQDTENGTLSVVVEGLWVHDEENAAPVLTYRWQRNGVDISGATGPLYVPGPNDAGETLQVIEIGTDERGMRS